MYDSRRFPLKLLQRIPCRAIDTLISIEMEGPGRPRRDGGTGRLHGRCGQRADGIIDGQPYPEVMAGAAELRDQRGELLVQDEPFRQAQARERFRADVLLLVEWIQV
jgi:hypothetical protein